MSKAPSFESPPSDEGREAARMKEAEPRKERRERSKKKKNDGQGQTEAGAGPPARSGCSRKETQIKRAHITSSRSSTSLHNRSRTKRHSTLAPGLGGVVPVLENKYKTKRREKKKYGRKKKEAYFVGNDPLFSGTQQIICECMGGRGGNHNNNKYNPNK